jgi:hypothetical protein
MRRLSIVFMVLLMCSLSIAPRASANPPPLPSIPVSAIINQVITQTGGPTYTPLGVTDYVLTQLDSNFTGALAGVRNRVSVTDTASYISTEGHLLESVMPLLKSGSERLVADMTAPGNNPVPGKIVGVLFQPSRMVQVIVAAFKPGKPNSPPEKVRLYWNTTGYYEYSIKMGRFKDTDGNGQPATIDGGAIITHKFSCLTIGLDQFCWETYDSNQTRDGDRPKEILYPVYTQAKETYDLKVDFYVDDALPDPVGPTLRANCARQIKLRLNWRSLTDCTPNLVFGASKKFKAGEPIAIFVLRAPADLKAFTHTGVYVGNLPAGSYLVVPATPHITADGSIGVLFLVNLDKQNHYLIPAIRMQGLADDKGKDNYAAIKDGSTGSWGF